MKILGEQKRDPYSYPEHHFNLYLYAKKKDLLTCSRFTMLTSAVFCHPALISFACGVINHDWIVASSTIYQRYQREIG